MPARNSRLLLLSLAFLLLACSPKAPVAQSATATMLREAALQSERAWQIVESLTTEIGPRLAGTPSDHLAVKWAQAQLQASGFDRVWLEPVKFPVWQRHKEQARIVSPYPQPLAITALGYSGSTSGEISAEVVAFDSLQALADTKTGQLDGKIVFVNQPTRRSRDGSGYSESVPLRYAGGVLAKERGAVAVLIRSIGTDSHRFPHTGVGTRKESPLPAAALSAPDANQLQRIIDRGEPVTLALDIQVSLSDSGHSWNVIGQLDGRELPEQLVLIAAHLDSWDLGTGAIDDGAGVGIVVAAAELIGQLPQRPRRSIRVVLFANEEQGIWGAKAYAQAHHDELKQHIYASESDFGAGAVWRFDVDSPALLEAAMPLLKPLGIIPGETPTSGGPDIRPLIDQGVPVFRLKQDGTDYFDVHHTADDTLDKIDPETLKQNVAAWAVVTYIAANQ